MYIFKLDSNSKSHNKRVKEYTKEFIKDHPFMFQYENDLILAAGIHDIGKSLVPNAILNSKNKLSNEERKIIDWHAFYGYSIAKKNNYMQSREMYEIICAGCGKVDRVPFMPRHDKPVYCSECFKAQKTE